VRTNESKLRKVITKMRVPSMREGLVLSRRVLYRACRHVEETGDG
jgi:hypothetical protein